MSNLARNRFWGLWKVNGGFPEIEFGTKLGRNQRRKVGHVAESTEDQGSGVWGIGTAFISLEDGVKAREY
jgi:hypothetical protein